MSVPVFLENFINYDFFTLPSQEAVIKYSKSVHVRRLL